MSEVSESFWKGFDKQHGFSACGVFISLSNVLIEWVLVLSAYKSKSILRCGEYPSIFGKRKDNGSVRNLFAEGVIDILSHTVPTASIEVVRRLLLEEGMDVSSSLNNLTVRSVVLNIAGYNGMLCWEVRANMYCV